MRKDKKISFKWTLGHRQYGDLFPTFVLLYFKQCKKVLPLVLEFADLLHIYDYVNCESVPAFHLM